MLFNGVFKIPMQFFILFIGVMVFVFYQYNPSPLNFNPQAAKVVSDTSFQDEYIQLEENLKNNFEEKTLILNEFLITENLELKNKKFTRADLPNFTEWTIQQVNMFRGSANSLLRNDG